MVDSWWSKFSWLSRAFGFFPLGNFVFNSRWSLSNPQIRSHHDGEKIFPQPTFGSVLEAKKTNFNDDQNYLAHTEGAALLHLLRLASTHYDFYHDYDF